MGVARSAQKNSMEVKARALLPRNICQKVSEHLRQELSKARAMAIHEQMDADRLRSQVSWLQGKR
jgi:cation transport regulator ChaB